MRNITPPQKDPVEALKQIGQNLHATIKGEPNYKHEIYHREEKRLISLYERYKELAIQKPCQLERLEAQYSDPKDRDALNALYLSEPKAIMDLRKEVFFEGDGKTRRVCPICGMNRVKDLDHYVPRAVMPEYSVHLLNLIPTCGLCNGEKHDNWKENNGRRKYFNAYFDILPQMSEILTIKLEIKDETVMPHPRLEIIPVSDTDEEPVRLAKATIEALKLIEYYWQQEANGFVNTFVNQVLVTFDITRGFNPQVDADCFWSQYKQSVQSNREKSSPQNTFIDIFVENTILASPEFDRWIINHVKWRGFAGHQDA